LRPGLRRPYQDGVFLVGNAAGEAHPVIAEGISIALQSSWLLCRRLIWWKRHEGTSAGLGRLARAYGADWRRHFAPRLYLSGLVAQWAMRPGLVNTVVPLLQCCPPLLTWFARLSGKAHGIMTQRTKEQ
jgi:flavin-dependent dehydrogenase